MTRMPVGKASSPSDTFLSKILPVRMSPERGHVRVFVNKKPTKTATVAGSGTSKILSLKTTAGLEDKLPDLALTDV